VHFGPILAALRRHRAAAALIILEIAFTCAIVCNALALISERLQRMQRPSGVAESELLRIGVASIGSPENAAALSRETLAALAAIPGVRKVATSSWLPFGGSRRVAGVKRAPDAPAELTFPAARYPGSEGLLDTLGVQLVAGRDFRREEYIDEQTARSTQSGPVIVTRALAERLWPGQNALGRTLYLDARYAHDLPLQVVGIIERLVSPGERDFIDSDYELSIVVPIREDGPENFVLRVDAERRTEVMAAAVAELERRPHGRVLLEQQTLEEMRARYYATDRAMAWLLLGVSAALLIITALGIVGLASFWVQRRTRQIGIRRALGATRGQIRRYFQAENLLLTTFGIALGMLLAYGINLLLMERYAIGRLPGHFLPVGALSLWLLGQLAVLGPARRAAAVPPAVATRTV
jgi:putative ABC transport system permease protein